ncbi:hypothetical protein ACP4OV_016382 [Aristida adscensionis]
MHLALIAIFGILFSSCSATIDTLSKGHSITGNMTLISKNSKFALGFFQPGSKSSNNTTLNSYLGIWFNQVLKLTPVWTANPDNPVSSSTSPKLMIAGDGNLVISAQGTIIWSTQANITTNDTIAVLLGNGNLVLQSSYNSSDIYWQSFDYPTDTLLSGAKIGHDKVTNLNRRLVSRKSLIDQASGVYSVELDLDGIVRLSWNSSIVYWSTGKWNGRFWDNIPEMATQSASTPCNYTFVDNDQEISSSYNLLDESLIFHNYLDILGQWKTRIWVNQDWVMIGGIPRDHCDAYAACGPFTICNENANQFCSCMKGFSVPSSQNEGQEDSRGGCIRNTPLNCGNKNKTGMTDQFYSVPNIRLPGNANGILNATSAKQCAQVCLNNCSCTAYSYGNSGCFIWHDELLNSATDGKGEILYLRLATNLKSNNNEKIIGSAIGASIAILGFLLVILIWRRRGKWSSSTMDNDHGGIGVTAFRYVDLQRATKNFSEKLGSGGFGSVFKGCLNDSVDIAVKRLEGAHQGEKQFRAEVNSIGIIQHVNLVKLIGFCCESGKRLLVYEHMPNSSLDAHLFESCCAVLDWSTRYQIALGIARAIAYLHHGCRDCIIHCDIKPQNILLDASFVPKLADFGMAKLLGRDFSHVVTTMRGTIGYLAPEWICGTPITSKVDVYSYGMVLLEIISGKRNSVKESSSDDNNAVYFPVQVVQELLHGDISNLVDANLHGDVNLEEIERVCKVACWCIQDNEFHRPTMGDIVQVLEGIFELDMPPMPRLLHAIAGNST